jgi:hypothetical protein
VPGTGGPAGWLSDWLLLPLQQLAVKCAGWLAWLAGCETARLSGALAGWLAGWLARWL